MKKHTDTMKSEIPLGISAYKKPDGTTGSSYAQSYTLVLTREEFILIQKCYMACERDFELRGSLSAITSAEHAMLDALHEGPIHDAWHRDDEEQS